MPVANKYVHEVLEVIERYVPADQVDALLRDLTHTIAYQWNHSYHETIDRLIRVRRERKGQ